MANDSVELHQFAPYFGIPNASPFCLKLELFLKATNIKYHVAKKIDFKAAPKGKFPCIKEDGKFIGDSNLIIDYLSEKHHVDLDCNLNIEDKAISLAFRRLFEENLYWVALYSRWIEEENWPIIRDTFFAEIPGPLRSIISGKIRKNIAKNLYAQGIGRHTKEEIYEIGKKDIKAIADFLDNKKYFIDDEISLIDCTAFAFLLNIIAPPIESPLKEYALKFSNITNYCNRIQNEFFNETKKLKAA